MKRTDFYYDLPEELIAQEPLKDRSSSRLMILDKNTGEIEHKHFYDIVDELNEGDALILNGATTGKVMLWDNLNNMVPRAVASIPFN